MPNLLRYVLISPVRNEAKFIRHTLDSVVMQTAPPVKWVIVSDGSTDGTDDIVRKYAAGHPWIELLRMPERCERHFEGKIRAFNAGYARVKDLAFEAIANLDGDVSFDEEYFAFLLQKLAQDSELGLVGTPYRDPSNDMYDYRFVSIKQVTGPCQLFRRRCFEDFGGYIPAKGGAVDRIADIAARMKGWKTRTFTEKVYYHYRPSGTAKQSTLMAKFRNGGKDYSVGTSPVWELFRTAYQMTKKPWILGGLMLGCGYTWALIRRVKRPVPREMAEFCRREQMQQLKVLLRRNWVCGGKSQASSSHR